MGAVIGGVVGSVVEQVMFGVNVGVMFGAQLKITRVTDTSNETGFVLTCSGLHTTYASSRTL